MSYHLFNQFDSYIFNKIHSKYWKINEFDNLNNQLTVAQWLASIATNNEQPGSSHTKGENLETSCDGLAIPIALRGRKRYVI